MAKHLIITGRVQGVWYRESMREAAQRLSVTGWVRNRRDGSVEAMVDGTPAAIEAIIEWARHGPPDARVDDVKVDDADGTFVGFERYPSV